MGAMELGSMINVEAIESALGIQVLKPTHLNRDQKAAHVPRIAAPQLVVRVQVIWKCTRT